MLSDNYWNMNTSKVHIVWRSWASVFHNYGVDVVTIALATDEEAFDNTLSCYLNNMGLVNSCEIIVETSTIWNIWKE
jgi:hypothetical protein